MSGARDGDRVDGDQPEQQRGLVDGHGDVHGVAYDGDGAGVAGVSEVVAGGGAGLVGFQAKGSVGSIRDEVDLLGTCSGGFLRFAERTALGGQGKPTIQHEPGEQHERGNDDDDERGHGTVFVPAQPMPGCAARRSIRCHRLPPSRADEAVPRHRSTGDEKLDSNVREPDTPSRAKSSSPTVQATVTVTVEPGRSP